MCNGVLFHICLFARKQCHIEDVENFYIGSLHRTCGKNYDNWKEMDRNSYLTLAFGAVNTINLLQKNEPLSILSPLKWWKSNFGNSVDDDLNLHLSLTKLLIKKGLGIRLQITSFLMGGFKCHININIDIRITQPWKGILWIHWHNWQGGFPGMKMHFFRSNIWISLVDQPPLMQLNIYNTFVPS